MWWLLIGLLCFLLSSIYFCLCESGLRMCVDDASTPNCVRIGLILRVLGGEIENCLYRWEKPWCWVQQKKRVAMPQELSLDFFTSTHRRGISSGPCRLVCCAGRRVYGCKRLDSVISLPTSGIAKQHKIHTGGNGPVSLSAENKLFVPQCSGRSSH